MSDEPSKQPDPSEAAAPGYSVGYGKPPVEYQFPKGHSGNRRGRPPKKQQQKALDRIGGLSSLSEVQRLWIEEANTPVSVSVNGQVEQVAAARAVMLSLRKNALSGNPRAQDLYLKNAAAAQKAAADIDLEAFEALLEYKHEFEKEVLHRNLLGRPTDDILPHPADVIVNPRSGFHKIIGPIDGNERRSYDQLVASIASLQDRVSEAAEAHRSAKRAKKSETLRRWHEYQSMYDRLNDYLPPSLQRALVDRSIDPVATKPGDFFDWAPEAIEAFVRKQQAPRKRRRKK